MNNKVPKTDLNKLKHLYLNTDMTLEQIGNELNVTFSTVKKWLKRLDLHRTKEHEERVFKSRYKTREQNLLNKYGVNNVSKLETVSLKKSETLKQMWKSRTLEDKDNIFQKVAETKLKKYGNSKYNNINKCLNTKLERYGNSNYNNMEQNIKTRSKNKTSGKSKDELILKQQLCEFYGQDNVHTQVSVSSTKHFRFDFQINNNLFIELNGEFWHNYRPYNKNNKKHIQEYYSLKQQGGMYKSIAKHWKYDDTRKLNYCIDNNINYIAIYFDKLPNNLISIIEKYKIGQNILTYKNNKLTVQRLSKT